MIKGSIQEDITLINIYGPNASGTPKYIKQIFRDMKGETDNNTIKIEEFNTPSMKRSSRQKMNKETVVLNDKTKDYKKQKITSQYF